MARTLYIWVQLKEGETELTKMFVNDPFKAVEFIESLTKPKPRKENNKKENKMRAGLQKHGCARRRTGPVAKHVQDGAAEYNANRERRDLGSCHGRPPEDCRPRPGRTTRKEGRQ